VTVAAAHPFAAGDGRLPASVRAADFVFVGSCMALDADGRVVASGDVGRQTELALDALEQALEAGGATIADVVGILSFHTDVRQIDDALEVASPRLGPHPPAWTPTTAVALPVPGALIAVSAIAHAGDGVRRCVTPDTIAWWRGLGVSAGCRKGDLIVAAGQYGSDADGNVNTPGDHAGQARNALNRVKEITGMLGGDLGDVIEVVSFHQDPRGIEAGARVYADEFFPSLRLAVPPTWTAAGAPALYGFGMLGQYQAIADVGGDRRTGGSPDAGPAPRRPGATVSRKYGARLVSAAAEVPAPSAPTIDPAERAHAAWDTIERGLAAAGAATDDVVAVTSFHMDMRDLDVVRDVMLARCGRDAPVWTPAGMTGFSDERAVDTLRVLAVTS
jgi:enamine deaminase RidA (YjgF/YER057c/UK114 family)